MESEEEDSEETIDFTPLQVKFPDSKEQSKSESSEEDSSTDEDTEEEWEHIFTGHTFAESVSVPEDEEPVDSMAIMPYELKESEQVKEQAPLSLLITLTFLSLTTYLQFIQPLHHPHHPSHRSGQAPLTISSIHTSHLLHHP